MGSEMGIRDLDFEATVDLETSAERPRLRLVGNADGSVVASFDRLIAQLHRAVTDRGSATVAIDIRALEFMSASCFNVFVAWIAMITELPADKRYRLAFQSNAAIPWQRRSLETLACFETNLVNIEV